MPYRLGLDLGTNSIGWCALRLNEDGVPAGLLDAGVRLITTNQEAGRDPQSKTSLAVERRLARSARRRRDRFLRRQERLMTLLIRHGLMPDEEGERKTLEALDPFAIRARALDEPVSPYELGRALFHINQRRGFKSNRIADADNEDGAVKAGIRALREALEVQNCRTLGEFLHSRHQRRESVRFRPEIEGSKAIYDFYPHRELVEEEIDLIWAVQKLHNPALTETFLAEIKHCIIAQRPLKPVAVGRCTFRPEEERAPRALPLFQRFRILQDLSSLMVERPGKPSRKLTLQERDVLLAVLLNAASTVPFDKLRSKLKLPDDARFNYEISAHRKGFDPDQTAAKLAKKSAFGKAWRALPLDRQTETVKRLLTDTDEDVVIEWLEEAFSLTRDQAVVVASMRLPQGHGHLGASILADLVDVLQNEAPFDPATGELLDMPLTYDQAVASLGLHHSDMRPGHLYNELPYYGDVLKRHVVESPNAPEGSQERRGRVTNPTVHIALNQVRRLINALIETHGPPAEIVVELARELKWNQKRKDEHTRTLAENTRANEQRRQKLQELGIEDTAENRLRLRLFDELPAATRVCVYSGQSISYCSLFSGDIEIDHILPFSQSLDDGFGNKVLCTRQANREKGARAPADAFNPERLSEVEARADHLFKEKAWRFKPDAMDRMREGDWWISRQLTDTQYMARLTKTYLGHICEPDHVWVVPGRMTAMLRGLWGLNSLPPAGHNLPERKRKERIDHRHHAVDAFVIACTDRAMLQRIARASGRVDHLDGARLFGKEGPPKPWDGYREELEARLEAMIVAHKADHGSQGQLHEDTAYGLVDEEIDGKKFNVVTRKPIDALTERQARQIRDPGIRAAVLQVIANAKAEGKKVQDALRDFGQNPGLSGTTCIRHVRVLETIQGVVRIEHGEGYAKALVPGSNHRLDIFEREDGAWDGEAVTVFAANQPTHRPAWRDRHKGARLIMTVHKGDLVELEHNGSRLIMQVRQLEPSSRRIRLAPHNESGTLDKRHADPDDPFRWLLAGYKHLQKSRARPVQVDVLGRVRPIVVRS